MFQINRSFPLFDKAGTDGGSGGGGTEGGKAAEPKLTDEMRAEIGALISGALKSEGKRQIAGAVKEALEGLKIGETIAAEVAKLKPAEPDPKADKGDKPDPKMLALEAQLTELKAQRQADADALKREKETSRDKDAMASLRSMLGQANVLPERLDVAARDLFVGQKRVTFDEQGNPLFTVRRAPYAGAAEEDVAMPLADGVQHWLKSPDAKMFLPAAGGQQQQQGGKGPFRVPAMGADGLPHYEQPATTDAEKVRRAGERAEALALRHPHLARQT